MCIFYLSVKSGSTVVTLEKKIDIKFVILFFFNLLVFRYIHHGRVNLKKMRYFFSPSLFFNVDQLPSGPCNKKNITCKYDLDHQKKKLTRGPGRPGKPG